MSRTASPWSRPPTRFTATVSTLYLVVLRSADGLPRFGLRLGDRLCTSALGQLVRQRWLNMILEYPEVGFERFAIHPDRFEAVVRMGGMRDGRPALRGIIAHFKASVTEAAAGESSVWARGFQVVALRSGNGTSITIPSRAIATSGKTAAASSSSSGASRE